LQAKIATLADQDRAGLRGARRDRQGMEAHFFAAERLHGDDTTVPVLAMGKSDTGRCATIGRSVARPPPAAIFYYSRDRTGEHPKAHLANYAGIFQAEAYSGYNKLYEPDRKPGPILEAACCVLPRPAILRRSGFGRKCPLQGTRQSPGMALEAVRAASMPVEIETIRSMARVPSIAAPWMIRKPGSPTADNG
jgi:transposase